MSAPGWCLGALPVDSLLGAAGLALDGVHEIKPALTAGGISAARQSAALLFTLLLARRRLDAADALSRTPGNGPALLWCAPDSFHREAGHLYAPGLAGLGLAPHRVVLVRTRTREETLWTLEEGVRSRAVALVIGVVDEVSLTPARRLSLAAEQGGTPCLLMTSPRSVVTASVATRWRVAEARSAAHPFDQRASGAHRLDVGIERCRGRPLLAEMPSFTLEWSNEKAAFNLVAGLADRAVAAHDRGRPVFGTGGSGRTWRTA